MEDKQLSDALEDIQRKIFDRENELKQGLEYYPDIEEDQERDKNGKQRIYGSYSIDPILIKVPNGVAASDFVKVQKERDGLSWITSAGKSGMPGYIRLEIDPIRNPDDKSIKLLDELYIKRAKNDKELLNLKSELVALQSRIDGANANDPADVKKVSIDEPEDRYIEEGNVPDNFGSMSKRAMSNAGTSYTGLSARSKSVLEKDILPSGLLDYETRRVFLQRIKSLNPNVANQLIDQYTKTLVDVAEGASLQEKADQRERILVDLFELNQLKAENSALSPASQPYVLRKNLAKGSVPLNRKKRTMKTETY
jgi:hypothetical protein